MAISRIRGVTLAGLSAAVPRQIRTLEDDALVFGREEAEKVCASTGVRRRHVVPEGMCASDLCWHAADRLLDDLGWERASIDGLIFVSQTPDYLLPATSCTLHQRLGLGKHSLAFDINLGCSGYVYGLHVGCSLVAGSGVRRLLLLVGDTITRIVSPEDRSAALLFGDAGTATALERGDSEEEILFELGTDGSGHGELIVPAGGFRLRHSAATARRAPCPDGNVRSPQDLHMNGAEIFAFTLREVIPLMRSIMAAARWDVDAVDAFVMHQANSFILQHISRRLGLPGEKVVLDLAEHGNTSCASIPLALTRVLSGGLARGGMRLILAGFGVGYSWGGAALQCGPMVVSDLLQLDASPMPSAGGLQAGGLP
jgi:3-oxoacyl-[acyl-carrier-protein] synthase-3